MLPRLTRANNMETPAEIVTSGRDEYSPQESSSDSDGDDLNGPRSPLDFTGRRAEMSLPQDMQLFVLLGIFGLLIIIRALLRQ